MASPHFLNALVLLLHLSVVLANIPIPPSPAPLPSPIDPSPPSHPPVESPPPIHLSPPPPPPSQPPIESPPPTHPPSPPPSQPPSPPPPIESPPPTHPPSPPPSHPPVESPPPPSHPYYPRFKVAVQGVVYCKSCKYIRVDTLMEAAPLRGAVVKLRCGYIKETAKTDENGYFFFMPPNLTLFDVHKCKVFLVSSPLRTCSVFTNLHDGARGATPVPFSKMYEPWPLALFNVGPFAFEPRRYCRH